MQKILVILRLYWNPISLYSFERYWVKLSGGTIIFDEIFSIIPSVFKGLGLVKFYFPRPYMYQVEQLPGQLPDISAFIVFPVDGNTSVRYI
jgi:hypothetical protein